ncbi:hypothetical protein [Candidatus Enterovibrio escicola]|uniref:hypothetical protein n=1 Tax=Candidatus Enterovibrio escicola TaxID=1927127 RepID=UPI001237E438
MFSGLSSKFGDFFPWFARREQSLLVIGWCFYQQLYRAILRFIGNATFSVSANGYCKNQLLFFCWLFKVNANQGRAIIKCKHLGAGQQSCERSVLGLTRRSTGQ